jgi:hypothetical protein
MDQHDILVQWIADVIKMFAFVGLVTFFVWLLFKMAKKKQFK